MTKDFEKLTAWGIVSSLIAKKTPNAIDLSLNFIENNFQNGFLLEGYKKMFKLIKEKKDSDWKDKSQKVFETMLKYYTLESYPYYGFDGVAKTYWENDEDFINQMRDLVVNSTTASDKFKRNILKNIFQDDNVFLKQVKLVGNDALLIKTMKVSDEDSKNLYITSKDFPSHVNAEDEGKEGYKTLNVEVANEDGDIYTLKVRVAKKYNGKLIAPNDSTGPVEGDTEFIFWIDANDNASLPQGIYSTTKAVKLKNSGHRENTYYDFGESILVIDKLVIFPELDTREFETNSTNFAFDVGDTNDTVYNFFNNPNFIDDTKGVKGKTDVNITVVDSDNNEYSLPVKMYQHLWGDYIYKADSAAPWKKYSYKFKIDVDFDKVPSDLEGKIVSSKEPFVMYKRAWDKNHQVVEKIIINIQDLNVTAPSE
jgi:hypothetical protein